MYLVKLIIINHIKSSFWKRFDERNNHRLMDNHCCYQHTSAFKSEFDAGAQWQELLLTAY